MSGPPLFTLVIFMKVDNISSTLLMFVLKFVLFFNFNIYSSDEGRQYFITLLMLVLTFAF